MRQLQKSLAYAKTLQYWAEKAQLPPLGKPCQIVESVLELWRAMEPLTTFTNVGEIGDDPPSNWQMITPSRLTEPEQPDQGR